MCENVLNFTRIANSVKNPTNKEIFSTLATREAQFCNESQAIPKQAILVLGSAKLEKPIFIRWIAEQDSKFESTVNTEDESEFTIVDPEGKSVASSVPILVSSPQGDAFYYDFPAFENSASVVDEIAEAYFTKKIIQSVPSVKMCFLMPLSALTSYGTRHEFTDFLKHVTKLVKNVNMFKDNLMVVVTGIPNNEKLSKMSDNEIIYNAVVRPMQSFKLQLDAKDKANESKMIEFLDLVAPNENQTVYTKLALFRSPKQKGPLSNITLLQDNKVEVSQKLRNLTFAKTTGADFGYAVSKNFLSDINLLKKEICDNIEVDVKTSANKVQRYFATKETLAEWTDFGTGLTNVGEQMKLAHEKIIDIKTSLETKTADLKQCLNGIVEGATNMTNKSIELDLSSTLDNTDALKIFETIVGGKQSAELKLCLDGLTQLTQYLDDSKNWYFFAKRLYDRLSECDANRNLGTYNLTRNDIDRQVSQTDLGAFLTRNSQKQIHSEYEDIKHVVLDRFKLETAQRIANLTIENSKPCSSSNSTKQTFTSITELYATPSAFIREFHELEKNFNQLSNNTKLLHGYKSLYDQINNFIDTHLTKDESKSAERAVFHYLQVAILSRMRNISNDFGNYVVVDLDGYLSAVEKRIRDYKNALKDVNVNVYREQYQNTINTRISEAYSVVESLIPEMEKIHSHINGEILRLVKEVEKLEKKGEMERSELIQHKNSLSAQLPLETMAWVLRVASAGVGLCGPMGAVASFPLVYMSNKFSNEVNADKNLANSMMDGSKQFVDIVNSVYPRERENLQTNLLAVDKLDVSLDVMKQLENDQNYKNVKSVLDNLKAVVGNKSLTEPDYWREKKRAEQDLEQFSQLILISRTRTRKPRDADVEQTDETKEELGKWAKRIKGAIKMAESGFESLKDSAENKHLLSMMDDSIGRYDETIRKLKEYEHRMLTQLMPEIGAIQSGVTNVLKNSANKSHAVLDKTKLTLQNLMIDFKKDMDNMIQIPNSDLSIKQTILACIDKLAASMTTSIQIYDRIQDYQDQARLANYIADLSSNNNPKDNSIYKKEIEQLELQIKANLVLQEYEMALSTYKQYMFPFVNSLQNHFNITSYLQPTDSSGLITTAIGDITKMRDELDKLATTIGPTSNTFFPDIRFDSERSGQPPFFLWSNNTNQQQISQLLQGRQVTLKADIAKSSNLNAVKFKEIGIRFQSTNKTIENHLRQMMADFRVTLTHLGDSNYRCDDNWYTFQHNAINMTHDVNTRYDGENNTYYDNADINSRNIKRNWPLFSPYATWKIQLQNKHAIAIQSKKNFQKLKIFLKEPINVTLEGRGSYVEFPASSSCNRLDQHYKQAGSYDESLPSAKRYSSEINSAVRIKSPINTAINWLISGTGWALKSVWQPNVMHHNLIPDYFRSTFANLKLPNDLPTEDHASVAASNAAFHVDGFLTLMDFFTRWLTRAKPYNNSVNESMTAVEIRAFSLNLVEQVETLLQFALPNKPDIQLDGLTLMSNLEKLLVNNRNSTMIKKVLYRAVLDDNPDLDQSTFGVQIWQKITEMEFN